MEACTQSELLALLGSSVLDKGVHSKCGGEMGIAARGKSTSASPNYSVVNVDCSRQWKHVKGN